MTALAIVVVPACFGEPSQSSDSDGGGCQTESGGWDGFQLIDAAVAPAPVDAPPAGDAGDAGDAGAGGFVCSPDAPNGIYFVDSPIAFPMLGGALFTQPTEQLVIGGTDVATLALRGSDASASPMTLPFVPSVPSGDLAIQGVVGGTVTLVAGSAASELDITDPTTQTLLGRRAYASLPIARAVAVPTAEKITGSDPLADEASRVVFAAGDETIGFALLAADGATRLVDTSATLSLAGANTTQVAWDTLHIPAITAGHYTVAIQPLGAPPTTASFDVVDHADALGLLLDLGTVACFEATSNGAFIAGLPWTFTVAGQVVPATPLLGASCVANPATTGAFTVTATAGGHSLTVTTTSR